MLSDQPKEMTRHEAWTWIAMCLAAICAWRAYSDSKEKDRVCELAMPANDIVVPAPLDAQGKPISPTDLKAIVANLKQIETEHNADGEIWRWQQSEGQELGKICNPRPDEAGDNP